MELDAIEKLKRQFTDKYVVAEAARPELTRFRGQTGLVKTVNMSGRALVEFDGYNNIGWYDIDPEFLTVVDKPPVKVEEKHAAKAEAPAAKAKPAAAPAKPAAAAAASAPAAGAKKSTADILAAARAKAAPRAAPRQPLFPSLHRRLRRRPEVMRRSPRPRRFLPRRVLPSRARRPLQPQRPRLPSSRRLPRRQHPPRRPRRKC